MDRLETRYSNAASTYNPTFTFQYGQIRNDDSNTYRELVNAIYIPVWIDQKQDTTYIEKIEKLDLHSSMDRLETFNCFFCGGYFDEFTFQYGQIRNLVVKLKTHTVIHDLHSSMDRLETPRAFTSPAKVIEFTFQYGQIRNLLLRI